jgi:1-acyl-sn-glycerol-3-phosphate acyltransferase
VSFVDPLVILAASPRPIRFVMDHRIFSTPIISFIFRTGKAIPIAPAKENEKLMNSAFDEVARALENGELVCIFPEGRITDNGELYPFRPGITRVIETTPVPVIPLALKGLWGSFFSRAAGRAMSNLRTLSPFRHIALVAASAVPPQAVTPEGLQMQVAKLRGDVR